MIGSAFFLLIVFLVFTSVVLIFTEFNGFVGLSNRANQQQASAKGASLGSFELLRPAVYVLAALSVLTVFQRIWHVRRELSRPSV